jgi:hypothetical protein
MSAPRPTPTAYEGVYCRCEAPAAGVPVDDGLKSILGVEVPAPHVVGLGSFIIHASKHVDAVVVGAHGRASPNDLYRTIESVFAGWQNSSNSARTVAIPPGRFTRIRDHDWRPNSLSVEGLLSANSPIQSLHRLLSRQFNRSPYEFMSNYS